MKPSMCTDSGKGDLQASEQPKVYASPSILLSDLFYGNTAFDFLICLFNQQCETCTTLPVSLWSPHQGNEQKHTPKEQNIHKSPMPTGWKSEWGENR